jgi:hypothetical protein
MAGELVSKVKGKKVVRRSKRRKTVTASPASLPPQVPDVDAGSPSPDANLVPAPKKAFWDVGKGSKSYEQAQKVLALKATGMDAASIAEALGYSKQTVHNLTYIASKNGWLTEFANAREQIEYRIMPKVLRVIEEGLEDTIRHSTSGQTVAQQIALDVAGGTVFKQFEQAQSGSPAVSNIIGIKVQIVPGGVTELADDSGGGVPAYADGEVVDVGARRDSE